MEFLLILWKYKKFKAGCELLLTSGFKSLLNKLFVLKKGNIFNSPMYQSLNFFVVEMLRLKSFTGEK